jgi:RimJ/RimL family protein N-acetyltransferase
MTTLQLRLATARDLLLYFRWANEKLTRQQSYHTEPVDIDIHEQWFIQKLAEIQTKLYVFENQAGIPVGQVRIEYKNDESVIGISIDPAFRGKGLAAPMIVQACAHYFKNVTANQIVAYIKKQNIPSKKAFEEAGFILLGDVVLHNQESFRYMFSKK